MKNRNFIFTLLLLVYSIHFSVEEPSLKCVVCRVVVDKITAAVSDEDPNKILEVGSFRIQPDGTQKQSQIKYAGSETHLGEVFETVCNSLEDYAQAKHKDTGEIAILNLAKDVEKLSTYELVQDPDLNRSLKYICESVIEDYEDDIIDLFKSSDILEKFSDKLCTDLAGYCKSPRTEL